MFAPVAVACNLVVVTNDLVPPLAPADSCSNPHCRYHSLVEFVATTVSVLELPSSDRRGIRTHADGGCS